jgi:type I restriction enzyme S subunit
VTGALKPYLTTKDSSVPWLGQVPTHWAVVPAKHLFQTRKTLNFGGKEKTILSLTLRGVVNNDPNDPEGLVPRSYNSYQIFEADDLVFKLIDLENLRTSRVGLVHQRGIMSPAYVRLSMTSPDSANIRFFFHQFFDLYSRGIYNQLGSGVRSTLGARDLLNIPILQPPLEEQAAIVRFLDRTNSHIQEYIRAKRELLALLNEQKRAIVHRAVTRGLDANVDLKPSGLEWLGEIPQTWKVGRLKQLSRILRGKFTHRPRNDPSLYDGPYPFIQTGEVAQANKVIARFVQTLNERGLRVSKLFPRGTLVMTIAANIGDVAILGFDACFPDSVVGFIPVEDIDRDYLYYLLSSMKSELLRRAPVNTQGNLNMERIGALKMPLPPIEEQRRIVTHIEESIGRLDVATGISIREIELLREYRNRLMADVLTGKVDVRQAVATMSDYADQPPLLDLSENVIQEGDVVDEDTQLTEAEEPVA